MNVALLVTGNVEWHGLGDALKPLFPGHTFQTYPSREEVRSNGGAVPTHGFTTFELKDHHRDDPPEAAMELVSRAASAAFESDNQLVVILDDLEVWNLPHPSLALDVFRAAVRAHLGGIGAQRTRDRTAARLRDCVSLHLAVPMIESWFFTNPTVLATTCGLAAVPPLALPDPEDFTTADTDYDTATETACSCWIARGRDRKQRPKWLGATDRRRHPKGYLQWLCLDGAAKTCTRYSEAVDGAGVALLRALDWQRALTRHPPDSTRMRYLAALVDDLSDALGPPAVGPVPDGLPHPLTSRRTPRREPVLRNL